MDNITDELLAAYLDGNATDKEVAYVLDVLRSNPELQEVIQVVSDVIDELDNLDVADINDKSDKMR